MNPHFQRETVARLTTFCERLIASGELSPQNEINLRTFVNITCNAFDMAPVQDRYEEAMAAIKDVLERAQ